MAGGTLELSGNELIVQTGQFLIGDGNSEQFATLSGIGIIHVDVPIQVLSNGVVSPGRLHYPGTIEIDGNIEFQFGSKLVVDLDVYFNLMADNLHATETVQLNAGAMLYGGDGGLGEAESFKIVTADGGVLGTFANTQNPIGLADDVVTVNYTANAVQVAPAPAPAGR